MSALMGAQASRTDGAGRFSIDGVGAGRVTISLSQGAFGRGEEGLGSQVVQLPPGEHLDVGTIVALPPVGVPPTERGTLGFDTQAGATFPVDHRDPGEDKHVWVTWVAPGGPAERAGVQAGDRVVALDGIELEAVGWRTLHKAFSPPRIRVGQRYALEVERQGKIERCGSAPLRQRSDSGILDACGSRRACSSWRGSAFSSWHSW